MDQMRYQCEYSDKKSKMNKSSPSRTVTSSSLICQNLVAWDSESEGSKFKSSSHSLNQIVLFHDNPKFNSLAKPCLPFNP